MSRDFWHFFAQETLPGHHLNRQKLFCEIFRFCEDISEIVVDFTDLRFSNFVIEYLGKNEKDREYILACSCGAQVESFEQRIEVENLATLPL